MFDGVTIRAPISYAKLYGAPGGACRFFGELCPSSLETECWRTLSSTTQTQPDLPEDIEVLKAYTRKLIKDLKREMNQNKRFVSFSSRLAKKLVCLGQMSDNELKTSFNLGLKIEVSNIHWLLNRPPWNATQEATTSVDPGVFELTDPCAGQSEGTKWSLPGSRAKGAPNSVPRKTLSETSTLSESPGVLGPDEIGKLSGISEASVLSEPAPYVNPRAFVVPCSGTSIYGKYPYQVSSNESDVQVRPLDSLIFLHRAGDFPRKKSSLICVPVLGRSQSVDSIAQIVSNMERNAAMKIVGQLEDGYESVLVIPDENDPFTYFHDRIRVLEQMNDRMSTDLHGALNCTNDITEMATFIANTIQQDNKSQASFVSIPPISGALARRRARKSLIPVRIPNFSWSPGQVPPTTAPMASGPGKKAQAKLGESIRVRSYSFDTGQGTYRRLKEKSGTVAPLKPKTVAPLQASRGKTAAPKRWNRGGK